MSEAVSQSVSSRRFGKQSQTVCFAVRKIYHLLMLRHETQFQSRPYYQVRRCPCSARQKKRENVAIGIERKKIKALWIFSKKKKTSGISECIAPSPRSSRQKIRVQQKKRKIGVPTQAADVVVWIEGEGSPCPSLMSCTRCRREKKRKLTGRGKTRVSKWPVLVVC